LSRAATALAALLALLAGCVQVKGRPPCANRVLHDAVGPGGDLRAVVFERACGSTLSVQVSLLHANDHLPDGPGNVFVAGTPAHTQLGPPVNVSWASASQLTVSFQRGTIVLRSEPRVGPVQIQYLFADAVDGAGQGEPQPRRAR
jgi:hypothetical protein